MNALGINLSETEGKFAVGTLRCKMLVMTSQENHSETVEFFRTNSFFGGDESLFKFFP